MHEAEFQRRQRRASVVRDWLAGMSIDQIAHTHDMADYTVRRILRTTPGVLAEHAERVAAEEQERRAQFSRQLHAWSQTHLGVPLHIAAERYAITTAMARDLLGERAGLHTGRGPTLTITDDQIIAAIQTHLATTQDLRAATYDATARTQGWPSLSTVTARYGTWRKALAAAGHPMPSGQGRPRKWSDEQLLAIVRVYLSTTQHPGWTGLQTWLTEDPARPSISLIRRRLGTWPQVLIASERCTPGDSSP